MLAIRPSTDGDVERISQIYGHYVLNSTATFELEPPGAEEIARRRAGVLAFGLPYLVAEQDGAVMGYAYAGAYRPRPAYRFTVEDSIYLDPACVGRGIGRVLLTALIELCEQGPWRQMLAVIGGSDNTASIRLHERFGFRHAGTLCTVGYKFGHWLDTVLMQRDIGAGAGSAPER